MIKRLRLLLLLAVAVFTVGATPAYAAESCGGTKTQLISCDSKGGTAAIGDLIKIAVTVMTILIGIVATGGIAYGAILYASARDNQAQVSNARTIIRNVIIGVILYGFTIAIINWLIPGGVIG